jgi:hypothetical protein
VVTGFADESPEAQKSVLVLYGERGDLPAIQAIEENIRQVFHASISPRIELFSEYWILPVFRWTSRRKVSRVISARALSGATN